MHKQDYRKLINKINQEHGFTIHSGWSFLLSVIELSLITLCVWGLFHVEPFGLAYWFMQAFIGLAMFRCFVLVHECGHRTFFKSRAANTVIGTLFGIVSLVPYVCWRDVHRKHHKWVGVIDKDPTSVAALDAQEYNSAMRFVARVLWTLRIPLAALIGIVSAFWLYPLRVLKDDKIEWARFSSALTSAAITLTPWIWLISELGSKDFLVLLGPALVTFYLCFETVNLCHHAGLYPFISDTHPDSVPTYQQEPFCRTAVLPKWLSVVCCYHFNLHTEHHLFPTVPWHFLPRVSQMLDDVSLVSYRKQSMGTLVSDIRKLDPFDDIIDKAPSRIKQPAMES